MKRIKKVDKFILSLIEQSVPPMSRAIWLEQGYPQILDKKGRKRIGIFIPKTKTFYYL